MENSSTVAFGFSLVFECKPRTISNINLALWHRFSTFSQSVSLNSNKYQFAIFSDSNLFGEKVRGGATIYVEISLGGMRFDWTRLFWEVRPRFPVSIQFWDFVFEKATKIWTAFSPWRIAEKSFIRDYINVNQLYVCMWEAGQSYFACGAACI